MHITARIDYALRAMLAVAAAAPTPQKGAALAEMQQLPVRYLAAVLIDLRRAGLVHSHRGILGGYTLTRPATEITVADVVTAIDCTLISVRGLPISRVSYDGAAAGLQTVWRQAEDAIHQILREATLADVLAQQSVASQPS